MNYSYILLLSVNSRQTNARGYRASIFPFGVWKSVVLYGPNRSEDCLPPRVSDEFSEDLLKCELSTWLSESVLKQTPVMSVEQSDIAPPITPPNAVACKSAENGSVVVS